MIVIVSDMKAISAFVLETRPLSFHPNGAYMLQYVLPRLTYQRPASQRDAAGINIAKYACMAKGLDVRILQVACTVHVHVCLFTQASTCFPELGYASVYNGRVGKGKKLLNGPLSPCSFVCEQDQRDPLRSPFQPQYYSTYVNYLFFFLLPTSRSLLF